MLNVSEVGNFSRTKCRKLSIFDRMLPIFGWGVNQSKFNRTTGNHVVSSAQLLVEFLVRNLIHTLVEIHVPR